MTEAGIPTDDRLPGAGGLAAAPGARAVASFLEARGWRATGSRPVQALYRPGREALVRHRVEAEGQGGARRALTVCTEVRARSTDPPEPPPWFAARHGIPDPVGREGRFLVWAFPYDPSLPVLPRAASGRAVRALLSDPLPTAVSVQALRYRPRRRAVFRYLAVGGGRAPQARYGKVLRAARLGRARQVLDGVRGRGVRLATGAEVGGLLLAPALPGRSLRDLLLRGGPLPRPDRLAALLRALDAPGLDAASPDPVSDAGATASLIARIVPAAADDAARVVEAVARGAAHGPGETCTIHGDLYENQVLVDRDFSLGLVDLDDVGPGEIAMDAATFSAHLLALAIAVPRVARRLLAYRAIVRPALAARAGAGEAELGWREALALLKLAPGPFRVLQPGWPDAVRRRVAVALRLSGGEES